MRPNDRRSRARGNRGARTLGWPRTWAPAFAAATLWLLLLVSSALFAQTPDAPRIGLVTMQPGEVYWARFGHNAILVDDGARRTLYNYGYFDFEQPGFLTRFLRGRMLYRLMALPMDVDLAGYADDGRGVQLQWLAIAPPQARELADFLAWNARPENAEYRYDYFTANCSTKVRDALDRALGGALKKQLETRSHGYSYRDEARRLSATLPWLYLGIHLGLGPFTDQVLSLWEESYIPMRLHDAVNEARNAQGEPLVSAELTLIEPRLPDPPITPPEWRWRFLAAGIALAAALLFALRPHAPRALRKSAAACMAVLWTACGLIGFGLLALWGFTDHEAAWGNENVLLFDPLCLLLLGAVPALWRGAAAGRSMRTVALAVALVAGFAMFLKFLPFRIQANGDWIALMLPVHAALALRIRAAPTTAFPR
jgi:hypothetical protein